MKIDRLLGLVIYLLNRESATAKEMAERFGVSIRTIQRDVDSLSLAGIPIISNAGTQGGYCISPSYKLKNHFVKKDDFNLIVMALKSLITGYENENLDSILEKYLALVDSPSLPIFLDYSVTKEDNCIQANNRLLETAILVFEEVAFTYRNVHGKLSQRVVQPLALKFKWYAWYFISYDVNKMDYRTFKVARIQDLKLTGIKFERKEDIDDLLDRQEKEYYATCENIEVWCHKLNVTALEEYFPEEKKERLADGNYLMHLRVPPHELLWKAFLLSMGDSIKILEPDYYRDDLIKTAVKFLSNYDIQMS